MRLSQNFTKTRKDTPKDEVSKNAQLLIRAGFIHKQMAGVYAYLPLGLKVLNNIVQIIREEMNTIGGQELSLSALQDKRVWEASGRWSDEVIDVWFKTKLHNGAELGLGTTHEEPLTAIMGEYVKSYRDLPAYPYQFQTKFRNELRAKSGIMRGREFLMKDLYSFSKSQSEHSEFYEAIKRSYTRVFERVGLGDQTFITFASGGSFSKYSHEFQTLTDAGEDTIYLDRNKKLAVNEEVYTDKVLNELDLKKADIEKLKAVEVGNIFSLGTRFSESLNLTFTDDNGQEQPVIMGSYGVGPGRVMGAIVEVLSDKNGLIWPSSVAPAQVHLAVLGADKAVGKQADSIYDQLQEQGIEVLYDDRPESAGTKLTDADLMGVPVRVVVSEKTLAKNSAEVKGRTEADAKLIPIKDLVKQLIG